jgi:hypothetical protein
VTFVSATAKEHHRARFFVLIDGLPYILSEESNPQPATTVTVWVRGDMAAANEYMNAFINGTQIGGNLSSGADSNVWVEVITDLDVSALMSTSGTTEIKGFGSPAVAFTMYNQMRFHFKNDFGDEDIFTLGTLKSQEVEAGATVIANVLPRQHLNCIFNRALSISGSLLNLDTMAQQGFSMTVEVRDSDDKLQKLFKKMQFEKGFCAAELPALDWAVQSSWIMSPSSDPSNLGDTILFMPGETLWSSDNSWPVIPGEGIGLTGRGLYKTSAIDHYGSAQVGERYWTSTPSFSKRRAQLWCGYKNNDGIIGDLAQIGTFHLDDAPAYIGSDRFELSFSDLSDFFRNRAIYQNYDPVERNMEAFDLFSSYVMPHDTTDGLRLQKSSTGTTITMAELRGQNGDDEAIGLFPFSYTTNASTIYWPQIAGNIEMPDSISSTSDYAVMSMQQVYAAAGSAFYPVLNILLSDTGVLANPYDILPGKNADEYYGPEFRMGAALTLDDVDEDSFVAIFARLQLLPWSMILSSEISVGELMTWFCFTGRLFWKVTPDGKLSVRPFNLMATPNDTTITKVLDITNILDSTPHSSAVSEDGAASRYTVNANYNFQREPDLIVNFTDFEAKKLFPHSDGEIVYDCPFLQLSGTMGARTGGLAIGGGAPVPFETVQFAVRRIMRTKEDGMMTTLVRCAWTAVEIEIGDFVSLTDPYMFNYTTGKQDTGGNFLCIGKKMNVQDGVVSLTLLAVRTGRVIAQSGEILSYSGVPKTVTFDPADPEWNGEDPTSFFAAGMNVSIFDVAGTSYISDTIASIVDAVSFNLTTGSLAISSGDILQVRRYSQNGQVAQNGIEPDSECIFQVDGGVLGPSNDDGTRFI